MARKLRPAHPTDLLLVQSAIDAMCAARRALRHANCHKAALAVSKALKSAEGAQRHVARRIANTTYGRTNT